MIEALLFLGEPRAELQAATDMIDIYEGSLPPSARFQVIDLEPTPTENISGD